MQEKSNKPNYFDLVYQVVQLIPKGRVSSYGAIANYLGMKSGARMVGYAMNAAHQKPEVPAHRVVNSKGLLSGKSHFSSPTAMQERLEAEGVVVKNDQVQNFDKVLWDPMRELGIDG